MIKEILRLSLLITFMGFCYHSYGQQPAHTYAAPLIKFKRDSSGLKLIKKDSTKTERIERLQRGYQERIVAIMTNTRLNDAVRLAEINKLIEEKSKRIRALQMQKEESKLKGY
jgi:hypothetical protein